VTRRLIGIVTVIALASLTAGCASARAFRQGNAAARAGDLDQAVAYYRTAAQAAPNNPNYKIALERAMLAASRDHFDKARAFEAQDQLEAARGEYRLASEYDPTNRQAAAKVIALDQTIRERIEAARPRPAIEQLRERARAASAPPMLNPASREPLIVRFNAASLRDILNSIGGLTGINITYDREVQDRAVTVDLEGVTLEQALAQLMTMNQLSYKVISDRSIFVFPDTQQKHAQYDDQMIQTFYVSHADATELSQLISSIIRVPQLGVQPLIQFNKSANTLTVRASTSVMQIIEKVIAQNDKPRAEIVIDVEILEVNRTRAKSYGLNLSEYALGGVLSPEVSPSSSTTQTPTTGNGTTPTTTTTATGQSTSPSGVSSPPPFSVNTISQGVSTSDFYLAVPTALVRFLETDTNTKLIAKPQLRGAEGSKLLLNLGDRIPVISTSYTPLATGGAGVNPLSSYTYQDIGVNIDMTPVRVTLDGDIILDLTLDNSSLGPNVSVAGVNVPSFGQRKVQTRLRLRDGESNLLAGLLREDERKSLTGFPGAIQVPILKQLFSANDSSIAQTDIVMLLTPHIIRTSGITEQDLRPIYIGSAQNLGLGGPPPLIAGLPEPAEAPPAAAAAPPTGLPAGLMPGPGGTLLAPPPGSTPVPGTVVVPPQPPPTMPAQPPDMPPSVVPPNVAPPAAAPPPSAAAPTPAPAPVEPPITTMGVGLAQVILSPPGATFRIGGGPYTIPISIVNVLRLSTVSLTLTFDPALLRVRSVQEGSFMRSAGANAAFTQQIAAGRVDITITRAGDATGASGTGLLAAVLFDAVAPGNATLTLSGAGSGPGGTAMGLQFRPVTLAIQP
jgi:general secretion pathway protein D